MDSKCILLIFVSAATFLAVLSAKPNYDKYFDGDCEDFKPAVADGFNEAWMLDNKKGFFAPMGSKILYYGAALMLDGSFDRNAGPDTKRECLKVKIGTVFTSVHGFGNKSVMECPNEEGKAGERKCTHATARVFSEVNGEKIYPLAGTVTYFNKEKSSAVMAICLGGKMKMWILLQKELDIDDPALKKEVTEHVAELGFSKDKTQTLDYGSCKFTHHF